jgi:hypothetical protein
LNTWPFQKDIDEAILSCEKEIEEEQLQLETWTSRLLEINLMRVEIENKRILKNSDSSMFPLLNGMDNSVASSVPVSQINSLNTPRVNAQFIQEAQAYSEDLELIFKPLALERSCLSVSRGVASLSKNVAAYAAMTVSLFYC